jgi:hypothetical protein
MSSAIPCPHAASKWVGIVTDSLDFKSPGPHMSVVTCERDVCVSKSIAKVAGHTNNTARLYRYEEL